MLARDTFYSCASELGPNAIRKADAFLNAFRFQGDKIQVTAIQQLRDTIGVLAEVAAFGSEDAQLTAHKLAWEIAGELGIYSASIDALYRQFGKGEVSGITVPAMNMRAIAFESARGVFQAMVKRKVGAAIFELSRGEIGFTGQRPQEYATVMFCAAIAEGFHGPLFLQGDHFQISASRYAQDPELELGDVKNLISEAVSAGFYNIDIDCSTLVDLTFSKESEQQRLNINLTAELIQHTRALEPEGVTISLGGEIGEVGEENSTASEVEVYLSGIRTILGPTVPGLTKLSIQSGTRHGGNVLADGSFGDMNIEFDLIKELSVTCRQVDGLAGCVQHGASMLSLEKIARLPEADCIEVHLAAAFLNAVYDHLPGDIVSSADIWLKENFSDEWKTGWSEAQFLHHARRYPVGPFKREWWDADMAHPDIRNEVRSRADAYLIALNASDSIDLINKAITHAPVRWHGSDKPLNNAADESLIRDLAD